MKTLKKDRPKGQRKKKAKGQVIDRSIFFGAINFPEDPIKMQRRLRGHE